MASPLQKISVKNLSRFMVALACGAGFSFGAAALYSSSLMETAGDSWQEYQHANAEQARAIGDVVDALGYGGMIHQFKNYVLRKDDARVRVVQLRAGASMESLARLESLVDSPAEMAAIGAIRGTINEYLDQLEVARELAKAGKSAAEIDSTIKVADGPALEGVSVLVAANVAENDTKSAHLGALRRELGYGGMIHHFKNFVLRQDEPRVAKVRAAIGRARDAIAEYDLHPVSPAERAALDAISSVISRYESGLATAMARVAEGATPEEIDAAVQVSDAPALEALTQLDAEAARATEVAADVLTYDLDTTITITYVIAALAFVIGGGAAIGSFFILSIGVARPSQRIADAIRSLAEGNLDIDVQDLESGTEIGQIARASQIFRENLSENQSLAAAREAAAERATKINAQREMLQAGVGRVVDAALKGDFSARIDVEFEDPGMAGFSDEMNRLVGSFQEGILQVEFVINELSHGRLGARMSGFERGAFYELQTGVNATMERLEDMVGRIHETTEATTRASDAIAAGAHQLSDRANNEAASIEQTASTMSMMTTSIRETAETASQGEGVASEAGVRAKSGGEIVSAAVDAMARIEESSKNIVEIINVIDAIAFQTNLLALNAAVEAARAGESGKGFAVVASEVRSLAQRAADAAKDISNLINESSAHVAEGGELVRSAGGALEEIREAVDGVVAQMTDITGRAREQASGAQEISEILASMDSTTQHNSELAVRSAANAEALARETHTLRELVAFFQVGAQTGSAPTLAEAA